MRLTWRKFPEVTIGKSPPVCTWAPQDLQWSAEEELWSLTSEAHSAQERWWGVAPQPTEKEGPAANCSVGWRSISVVKKLISDVVCRFQNGPRIKPKVVHYDQVEPYRWLKLPNWLPLDSQPPKPGEQMEVVTEAEVETTVPDHLTFFFDSRHSTLDQNPDSSWSRISLTRVWQCWLPTGSLSHTLIGE